MKDALKKAISVLLVAVMVFGSAPIAGFVGLEFPEINLFSTKAEAATYSGTCGENLTWTFDESTGELVISGEGAITSAPWRNKYNLSIKTVIICEGVTSIGANAFYSCDLVSITIPESITTIERDAVVYCDELENVYYLGTPEQWAMVTVNYGNNDLLHSPIYEPYSQRPYHTGTCGENLIWKLYTDGELVISGTGAMSNSLALTFVPVALRDRVKTVTISDGVTSIANYAFSGCTNLESVTIPESVTSIGFYAFLLCSRLKSITIPRSVRSVGEAAFAYCTSLENITISNGVALTIGPSAFIYCSSLINITIPANVRSIGEGAFLYCENLKKITVNSANQEYSSDEHGVLFSKNKVKLIQYPTGNTSKDYKIPNSVTNIVPAAFALCTSLESVSISKNTTNIGQSAFYGCTSLQDIYYGGSKMNWENVIIDIGNDELISAEIHYNSTWEDDSSTEIPDNTPDYDSSATDTFLVPSPTESKISYGDSIVLHLDPSKIPEGGYVEWYPSNGNFSYSVSADGTTCTITPSKSGDTTFTAIVYDAEGNIIFADTQTMTSKAGFFDKIIAFFKKLFGLTKTIPEAVKVIY